MEREQSKVECGGTSNTPAERTDKRASVKVLLDWLGFTFTDPETSLDKILQHFNELLQIDFTDWKPGRRYYEGYANSLVFENINIYYEGASNQGIHVDITGQGCRYIEIIFRKLRVQLSTNHMFWFDLMKALISRGAKFTRVDIAIDDFGQYYTVPYIFQKCLNGELTMKFKSWSPNGYFGADGNAKTGMTIYFGSDVSRFQVCMYEKAKQLGLESTEWTRTELRFRHERAIEFIQLILANNAINKHSDIGVLAAGILKDYITFRDFNYKDSNKRRWKVSSFWEEFLKGVEPQRLASALPDRSILRTATWFKNQVSKSYLMMELAFYGIKDEWKEEMIKEGSKKMTNRDMEIIQEFRRLFEQDQTRFLDNAIDMQ
ncbi:replication initiation factor domain-containing protein [Paenibacillus sp. GCM10012307]|uniref:Replication initiation factor domain-containing protein n=1 Tax=Paenibacillus roseus TaxID=2798579 RepID=A0A934J6J4_9BACL|nr:replication initiation factor domain-containing protein [Paenibacillus roseus]MBJ6361312.1 replication initiation factor domain-containing protein [Paenibacillus roseus]